MECVQDLVPGIRKEGKVTNCVTSSVYCLADMVWNWEIYLLCLFCCCFKKLLPGKMPRYQEMAFWCDTVLSAELFWTSDWTECPAPGKQLRSGLQIQRSCFPSVQAAFTKYFWRCTRLDVECLCREAVRPLSVSLVCFHRAQVSWSPRCACRDTDGAQTVLNWLWWEAGSWAPPQPPAAFTMAESQKHLLIPWLAGQTQPLLWEHGPPASCRPQGGKDICPVKNWMKNMFVSPLKIKQ